MRVLSMLSVIALTGMAMGRASLQAQPVRGEPMEQRGQLSEKDYKFVQDAARGNMAEIQLGQLAQQKGASQSVRNFGERMVTDSTKANNELKQIVAQKGATVPTQMSHKEGSAMEHLQKETGAKFDKAYAEHMVKDHKHEVKEYRDAAKNLNDPDLRAYAQKTLPTLEDHQRMANEMEQLVKK